MKSNKRKITSKNVREVFNSQPIGFETKDGSRGFLMAKDNYESNKFMVVCSRKFHRRNNYEGQSENLDEILRFMILHNWQVYTFDSEWTLLRWLANTKRKTL